VSDIFKDVLTPDVQTSLLANGEYPIPIAIVMGFFIALIFIVVWHTHYQLTPQGFLC
jgi:hypothetical protein